MQTTHRRCRPLGEYWQSNCTIQKAMIWDILCTTANAYIIDIAGPREEAFTKLMERDRHDPIGRIECPASQHWCPLR